MSLLLDTHALVWHFLDSPRLPEALKEKIDDPETIVFVSAASAWEIATKFRIGRFAEAEALVSNLPGYIREYRFTPLPITFEHGWRAGLLAGAHKDPFDRMLAAQAIEEKLGLVSADPALAALGAKIVW
jgi:PIN domain nuclease of toxin-antitoxin system